MTRVIRGDSSARSESMRLLSAKGKIRIRPFDRRFAVLALLQRVLVTEGAGFIGSHLCDRLLKAGHEVPADDPVRRQPDITLAKNVLGWQPTIQMREGFLRTIDYFRSSDSALMAPIATAQLNS